jgi:hypothetical protein
MSNTYTIPTLLAAIDAALARTEAALADGRRLTAALRDIQRYVDSGVGHGMSTNGLEYVLHDIDRRATAALTAPATARVGGGEDGEP